MEQHTFSLEAIEPIDHAGVVADPAEWLPQLDQVEDKDSDRPSAGRAAGFPLAKMFVSVNVIVAGRLFPSSPLTAEELRELEQAAAEVEAYYAPDLSGPWWLWARLAVTAGAVYGPRLAERRAIQRAAAAHLEVEPEGVSAELEVDHG